MSTIFMCWVAGTTRPKKQHTTIEIAMAEAKRLSELPDIKGRVYVLADVAVLEKAPRVFVEKERTSEPVVTVKKKRLIVLP